jgi:hypothetical protein
VPEDVPSQTASSPTHATATGAPKPLLIACALIGLQGLGLLVAAGVLLADSIFGHPTDRASALLGAAFALAGGLAFGFGARGLLRLRPAARTPVVVLEVLTVPVAYSVAFDSGRYAYGGPILLVALAVLYLLFTPPARAVLDREDPVR